MYESTMYEPGHHPAVSIIICCIPRVLNRLVGTACAPRVGPGLDVQPATAYSTERGFSTRFEAFRISIPTTFPSLS